MRASKQIGNCETVNCGRFLSAVAGQPARVEGVPASAARMRIEAIGDVFNLFNALEPGHRHDQPTGA